MVVEHHIKKYGSPYVECKMAKDGREMEELSRTWQPDIVFADIRMPGISGLEAIEELRDGNDLESTSFYIMSGYEEFSYARTALQLQVKDYLLKPIHEGQIAEILSKEEARRYLGIAPQEAHRLGDEIVVYRLSLVIQRMRNLFGEKQYGAFLEVLEEWKGIAKQYGIPIEHEYFVNSFQLADSNDWREQYARLKIVASTPGILMMKDKSTQAIIAYTKEHFTETTFCLDQIANHFSYSAQYLSVLFKRDIGRNFSDYLADLRIRKAKELLAETDIPIKEIGTACGYSYSSYFIKRFNEENHMTPVEYRKSLGNK